MLRAAADASAAVNAAARSIFDKGFMNVSPVVEAGFYEVTC